MSQKPASATSRERWQIERFAQTVFPDGRFDLQDGERPDFVLIRDGYRVGVEHTALHWPAGPAGPRQEREGLLARVCAVAAERWLASGQQHVEVWVLFEPGVRIRKADVAPIAAALVTLAGAHVPPDGEQVRVERPWSPRQDGWPPSVHSLRVSRLVKCPRTSWHSLDSDYIPPLAPDYLQQRIDDKNAKLGGYAPGVDEHWLVLTLEAGRLSSTFDVPESTRACRYRTAFSRLYIFEPHLGQLIPLEVAPASPD